MTTTLSDNEWIFSVQVPANVPIDGSSVASPKLVELRQTHVRQRSITATTVADNKSSSSSSENEPRERVSLLRGGATEEHRKTAASWKFTSPYWSLESDQLLTLTYRPAWQALPEFTTTKNCGSRWFSCCSQATEVYQETLTVQDVVRVERIPVVTIPGIGVCQALRLHLRPLTRNDDLEVPMYWQTAWERHLQRMTRPTTTEIDTNVGPILTFCLPKDPSDRNPPLLWKVHLPPVEHAMAVETLTILDGRLSNVAQVCLPTHLYIQGYQSWSYAGSIVKGDDQPTSALPNVMSRAFNAGGAPPPAATTVLTSRRDEHEFRTPKKYKYQSDFFTCITSDGRVPTWLTPRRERRFPYQTLDETGGPALLLGWLTQHEQYGVIAVHKDLSDFQMHASCQGHLLPTGSTFETDWAYAQLLAPHSYDEEPMVHFLHAVADANAARVFTGSLLTGWCSWYHYYENIDSTSLRDNFGKLAALRTKVPTNVAVVDDGYITAWGDWDSLKPTKFPDAGMPIVAQDIVRYGMRPGLWLAPYAADKHSEIVKQHPDWIIRNDQGVPANSSNCGKFFYGLDATNPAVRQHVYEAIRRAVQDWKYNVLKIDFLYAACLEGNGKYDLSLSRAQAMHLALQTIRDAAGPDVFLIGCGCPIASGVGFVDGMRVSADTGPTWYPPLPLPWWDHGTLPCLRSMVRNSMTRAPMGHRWWHNDPDCLLLGESTRLTDEEVASAASIVAMTCGMMLLSDDLTKVGLTRMRILTKIFPLTGVTGIVLDLHSSNDGLPSLLRLWCSDKFNLLDNFRESMPLEDEDEERDHNAEATYFARRASYRRNGEVVHFTDRQRSCIHVTQGLGTWTIVSISNWSDLPAVVHVPPPALLPPPETGASSDEDDEKDVGLDESSDEEKTDHHGYHVFAFWSSKYSWIQGQQQTSDQDDSEASDPIISKKLVAHETEIFHIKPVTPDVPQYIGSDLHFSCGQEVRRFRTTKDTVQISLKTDYNRVGYVYVFVPTTNTDRMRVTVNGEKGRWIIVGNTPKMIDNTSPRLLGRVVRIMVVVHGNGTPNDGQVTLEF